MAALTLLKFSTFTVRAFLNKNLVRSVHQFTPSTYAQTLVNIPDTKITTLDNGFRIASQYSDSPTCCVGVWIDAGIRYETDETNGVANFFEHMAFKGTRKRTQKQFEQEVQNLGAQINAYTSPEETAFYSRCLSKDISKAVDLLGDMITNTGLDENQMEEERKVILAELEALESNLEVVTFDQLHMVAYQKTPLGRTIYGPSKNIRNLTVDDLAFYARENFISTRMVLVGSGDFKHDELVKLAEKHFSSVPFTYTAEIPVHKPCRFTGSEVRIRDDWIPLAHVAVAIDTCGLNSPDIYPLLLAKTMIGKWDRSFASGAHTSNQLIENIYRGEGCHSFKAFHTLYRDTGLWGIYFVMNTMDLTLFLYNLQTEWMMLCTNVNENSLVIAKNALRTEMLLALDNPAGVCADIGRSVLNHERHIPFAEIDEKIQAVTIKDMTDVCSKYIYDRCPAIAAVGPVEGLPDYTRIRAGMYWMRL